MTCDSAGNISYTRAGSFETDKNGYIVNASGAYLQGYPVDDTGTLQTGTVTDIQIKTGNIPAQASSSLTFTANRCQRRRYRPHHRTIRPDQQQLVHRQLHHHGV